jgi:hypothetical protein
MILEATATGELSMVPYEAAAEMVGSVKMCSCRHLLNQICCLTFAATARGCGRFLPCQMGGGVCFKGCLVLIRVIKSSLAL